ncbi:ankyrin repeat domain-containing protein [Xanthomonas maliensis]|nr:ankyrin repeat domain-containing protein [Xanthomonas maliensis]
MCWLLAGCGMSAQGQGVDAFDGPLRQAAEAIQRGDPRQLRTLAQQGVALDGVGKSQLTLLWYAIQTHRYDAVRELVALGVDPDTHAVAPLGTPLQHALTHDTALLAAMLDGGLSPNHQAADGVPLLQRAVFGDGAEERVRLLVERGADVNLRDDIGDSALSEAIDARRPDIALYLLEHGAAWDAAARNGDTPAWGVEWTLRRLGVAAPAGKATDISVDAKGEVVRRDTTPAPAPVDPATAALRQGFERLRAAMIAKGAQFPADPPATVRARMKAAGQPVAE